MDPTRDLVYMGLAEAYMAQGDLELAEDTYKEAIAVRPHYWAPHNWLGIFYFRHGRAEEALESFQEMVRLAPDSYLGYTNLGAAYYFMGRQQEARDNFERALEIKPDDALALSNLATMNFFEGRYAESINQFEQVVALNDKDFFYWGSLADAYRWGGGTEEQATSAYRKAISLCRDELIVNPDDAILLADMAYYYAMTGAEDEALRALQRAIELMPADIDVHYRGSQAYQGLGDRTRALGVKGTEYADERTIRNIFWQVDARYILGSEFHADR